MAVIQQYECDECGAVKGATNHWWVVAMERPGALLLPLEDFEEMQRRNHRAFAGGVRMVCGQACAVKRLSIFMGETVDGRP